MTAHVVALLHERAKASPDACVYRFAHRSKWRELSLASLDHESARRGAALKERGIGPGHRVLMLVPPGAELFCSLFGVMRAGATPVLIDPVLDSSAFSSCLNQVKPGVLLGSALANVSRWGRRDLFPSIRVALWAGKRLGHREPKLDELASPLPGEPALVVFTSGATGSPKACGWSHAQMLALTQLFAKHLHLRQGDVSLTTFAPFGLFAPLLGVTSVFPLIDFSHPAQADPNRLAEAIRANACTTMFGSPALVNTLSGLGPGALAPLRRIFCAGAPVSERLISRMQAVLGAEGEVVVPYGSTESLLVSVRTTADGAVGEGPGTCVGIPVAQVQVTKLGSSSTPCAVGEIGDLWVCGPGVMQGYVGHAPLSASHGLHGLGDVGCLDHRGQLWISGRATHCVERADGPLFPGEVEPLADACDGVRRSALIGLGPRGAQRAVLLLEQNDFATLERVRQALARSPSGRRVDAVEISSRAFPVDVRHEAKIDRSLLATRHARVEQGRFAAEVKLQK